MWLIYSTVLFVNITRHLITEIFTTFVTGETWWGWLRVFLLDMFVQVIIAAVAPLTKRAFSPMLFRTTSLHMAMVMGGILEHCTAFGACLQFLNFIHDLT